MMDASLEIVLTEEGRVVVVVVGSWEGMARNCFWLDSCCGVKGSVGKWLAARGCLPVEVGEVGVAGLGELVECSDDNDPDRDLVRAREA